MSRKDSPHDSKAFRIARNPSKFFEITHAMKSRRPTQLVKGLSIDEDLFNRASEKATSDKRSFSQYVRLCIENDLRNNLVKPEDGRKVSPKKNDDLMDTAEVAALLNVSSQTIVRRLRKASDPLRKCRSRLGKKRPLQFYRSKIIELERGEAA